MKQKTAELLEKIGREVEKLRAERAAAERDHEVKDARRLAQIHAEARVDAVVEAARLRAELDALRVEIEAALARAARAEAERDEARAALDELRRQRTTAPTRLPAFGALYGVEDDHAGPDEDPAPVAFRAVSGPAPACLACGGDVGEGGCGGCGRCPAPVARDVPRDWWRCPRCRRAVAPEIGECMSCETPRPVSSWCPGCGADLGGVDEACSTCGERRRLSAEG